MKTTTVRMRVSCLVVAVSIGMLSIVAATQAKEPLQIETVKYLVSADGKTLTVTQTGTLNGAEVTSVQVFLRQQ